MDKSIIAIINLDSKQEKGLNVAPFLTTHAVKSHIVLGLKSALEHSKVKLLNHEIQKKELLAFEEKGSVNGSFSYSAPSGLHDDCVMPSLTRPFHGEYRSEGLWSVGDTRPLCGECRWPGMRVRRWMGLKRY